MDAGQYQQQPGAPEGSNSWASSIVVNAKPCGMLLPGQACAPGDAWSMTRIVRLPVIPWSSAQEPRPWTAV
jgi:hypothetical protein